MPLIQTGGLRHYYRIEGNDSRPVLMFSHSLGCDHTQWDAQAADLQAHSRVLRYDIRGHGASDVPPGDYTIEMLARDALAIADALGIARFAFCGLSLGGMIGQWLAANAPDRLTHVVLANTSSRFPDPSIMESRRRNVLEHGMAAVADAVMQRFFTAERLASNPPAVANIRRVLLSTSPIGYAGCCAAVRDMDQTSSLRAIRTPVLIVVGGRDVSTPWDGHGEVLAREIAQARVERLATAHLSNVERPRSFGAALLRFLLPAPGDILASGLEKRRQVLGDAHVDRAIAATTDFTRAFQELITAYAWGAIWQRPGLDDRTRRLLVLTATAALGRWEEFRLHVRTGLERELEPCDIQEALLQIAVYAGVPAANTGFQIAAEEIAERDKRT
jgi:3-oxoadipate enol-lactonase/4-carboxymuconolactone decarboxylase